MQELSNDSGASLAQVYKVLDLLQAQNYVIKNRGAIGLADPQGLLTLWATNYKFNEQKITGYYSPIKGYDQIFSELRKLSDQKYALTLGAAAQLVLPVVRSIDVYLYAEAENELKKTLQLEPVEFGGNVYLVTPKDDGVMKSVQIIDGVKLVSNIQLYLDLYNYPQRGREQADAIREKLLGV